MIYKLSAAPKVEYIKQENILEKNVVYRVKLGIARHIDDYNGIAWCSALVQYFHFYILFIAFIFCLLFKTLYIVVSYVWMLYSVCVEMEIKEVQ